MVTDYLILETTFRWKWAPASRPPPTPSRMLGFWCRGGQGAAQLEQRLTALGHMSPLVSCGFQAGRDVNVSVGSLNQAGTAVCQRYKNMQSPSSQSPLSLESWLVFEPGMWL